MGEWMYRFFKKINSERKYSDPELAVCAVLN
jgi:hypothetical protein